MNKLLTYFDNYETILWDWNGTLINDVDLSNTIANKQILGHGLKPLSKEELQKAFCFPIKNYYEKLGFNLEGDIFKNLSKNFIDSYEKEMASLSLFEGTETLLNLLSDRNQFIISAAEEVHLKEIVSSHGISHHFTELYGLRGVHGHSKVQRCKDLVKDFSLDPKTTLLVGDTEHDAEVAKNSGINSLIIADGFQHYDILKKLDATVLRSRFDHFKKT